MHVCVNLTTFIFFLQHKLSITLAEMEWCKYVLVHPSVCNEMSSKSWEADFLVTISQESTKMLRNSSSSTLFPSSRECQFRRGTWSRPSTSRDVHKPYTKFFTFLNSGVNNGWWTAVRPVRHCTCEVSNWLFYGARKKPASLAPMRLLVTPHNTTNI